MSDNRGAVGAENWTLITVSYDSAKELRDFWAKSGVGSARQIVVDNASTDDSVGLAEASGADVIRLPQNVGFARANNVALAEVTTPWVAS